MLLGEQRGPLRVGQELPNGNYLKEAERLGNKYPNNAYGDEDCGNSTQCQYTFHQGLFRFQNLAV